MTILDQIFERKRQDVRLRSRLLADYKSQATDAGPTRGFARALASSDHRPALIAEVKRASPVKGMIRDNFDPVAIAKDYARAGVDCISVLTDVEHFKGSSEDLQVCRTAVSLPFIRKDFTAGELHVYEARAIGADAILLIVNGLSKTELREYRELAESLGMDVLVEAHTLEEANVALESGANLLGINNRDLATFEVSLETSEAILPILKARAYLVSESALANRDDINRVVAAGAEAVLIGTAFCAEPDVAAAVKSVMPW